MKLLNLDRADFEPNLLDTGIQLVRIDFLLLNRLVVEGNFAKLLECLGYYIEQKFMFSK